MIITGSSYIESGIEYDIKKSHLSSSFIALLSTTGWIETTRLSWTDDERLILWLKPAKLFFKEILKYV